MKHCLNNEFDAKNDFTINVGELLPVIFAVLTLEHLGLLLPGDVIRSTSDNDCVVSWIRSFRAKAPLALDLLKLLVLTLCLSQLILATAYALQSGFKLRAADC